MSTDTTANPTPAAPVEPISPMTIEVAATEDSLDSVGNLVDSRGNLLPITGSVYESSAMPGMLAIEVFHGTLYVDADETVTVPSANAIPLARPVTARRLKKVYGKPGEDTIVVSVLMDLDDLIGADMEAFNDAVQAKIIGHNYVGSLMDLGYEVTGHQDGSIVVTVTADASEVFSENLCTNFDECEGVIDDGEGYDGECGDCADKTYAAEHAAEDEDEDEDDSDSDEEN